MRLPRLFIILKKNIRLSRSILRNIRPIFLWAPSKFDAHLRWVNGRFEVPAPQIVKWGVLKRWGDQNLWIETGTYLGDTTQVLAQISNKVISIEPDSNLFRLAEMRFRGQENVQLVHGSSETKLGKILDCLTDYDLKSVCFWLDGHFSSDETYQGTKDTPIREELNLISQHLDRFGDFLIFIDDFRCFSSIHSSYPDYPRADYLVDWATSKGLSWTVEFDIFIIFKISVE